MKKKCVIFDLDGVLINSVDNMEIAWSKVCRMYNLSHDFKVYFNHIGKPFKEILTDIGIHSKQEQIMNSYKYFSIKHFNKIKIYPDVTKVLKFLKKKQIKIGIVTSKDYTRTRKIISNFNLNIDLHISPNKKLNGKPSPDTLLFEKNKKKFKKKDCVYVGDTKVDYLTAKRAKIDFIFVKYGYYKEKLNCKNKINKFLDIKKIINV